MATDLITKLEEAGEGSRGLDALVNLHFHRDREYLWSLSGLNAQRQAWKDRDLDATVLRSPSEYGLDRPVTTSLDAALALAERLGLDGWNTLYAAMMSWKAHDPRGPLSRSLPLALCAAILRASEDTQS